MSTPARKTFLDSDNRLLAGGPAQLDTGVIGLPAGAGNVGAATIRTASTTLSLFMTASELDVWADVIRKLAEDVRNAPVLDRSPGLGVSALMQGNARPG